MVFVFRFLTDFIQGESLYSIHVAASGITSLFFMA